MFCKNCGNEIPEGTKFCANCGQAVEESMPNGGSSYSYTPPQNTTVYTTAPGSEAKSKMAAGLLGIFLGGFGIHNFYLGFTNKALIQLLVSLIGGVITCGLATVAMEILGLVEGIQILTGTINTDAQGVPLKD